MLNKIWHEKNKMPVKPTLAQRVKWYTEHQKHCACRELPKSLQKYLAGKKAPRS